MANIFDYLDWRGDITFKKSKFNEIDNIIAKDYSTKKTKVKRFDSKKK